MHSMDEGVHYMYSNILELFYTCSQKHHVNFVSYKFVYESTSYLY